jgi:hypothetical protein
MFKIMVVNILIYILKSYQKIISPLLPGSCRYYPSCSQYTIEVLQKYGLYKGLVKAIWRILRCNPFSAGGYDPS